MSPYTPRRTLELLRNSGPYGATVEDFARCGIKGVNIDIHCLRSYGFEVQLQCGDTTTQTRFRLLSEPEEQPAWATEDTA